MGLSARDEEALERLKEATLTELHRWEGASGKGMSFQNAGIFLRLTPFNGKALEAGYRSLLFSHNVADLFPLLGPWPHRDAPSLRLRLLGPLEHSRLRCECG